MSEQTDTAGAVLAKASCYDPTLTHPDPNTLAAWAEALQDIPITKALDAVAAHYRTQSRRIMPADVIQTAAGPPIPAQHGNAEPPPLETIQARHTGSFGTIQGPAAIATLTQAFDPDRIHQHITEAYNRNGWDTVSRAARNHRCPWCHEAPTYPCTAPSHQPTGQRELRGAHPSRIALLAPCHQCGAPPGAPCAEHPCPGRDTTAGWAPHIPEQPHPSGATWQIDNDGRTLLTLDRS